MSPSKSDTPGTGTFENTDGSTMDGGTSKESHDQESRDHESRTVPTWKRGKRDVGKVLDSLADPERAEVGPEDGERRNRVGVGTVSSGNQELG